jgi:hypothetical protein
MKTFVLALTLLAPDGSTTEVPVELWQFASMAECTRSSTFMNTGKVTNARNYSCIEFDPSLNAAKAVSPAPKREF